MARGINKVILVGNLGRDPELTYTPSGLAVGKFSIATTEGRKNAEGEWADHTEWHNIVTFGKTAETAGQYLQKGRQVYIEGRLSTSNYEKDGVKRYRTDVIANTLLLLGRRDESAQYEGGSPGYEPPQSKPQSGNEYPDTDVEDDLPF